MTRLQQLESDARVLTDAERATFAAHLLASLPSVLADQDEGVAEALRREAEMDAARDPGLTWDEMKKACGR